jgi:hypothetical protein
MNKSNQVVAGQNNPSLTQNSTILIGEFAIGTEGFILNEVNQIHTRKSAHIQDYLNSILI